MAGASGKTRGRTVTDSNRETEQTDRGLGRRTILKGTAAAGIAGAAVSGTASAQGYDNEITFFAPEHENTFRYEFSVTGGVERGNNLDSGDVIVNATTARGAVGNGRKDTFFFGGELKSLRLDGAGKVFVNGNLIRDTMTSLPNRIKIRAQGQDVSYKFKVSDRVKKGQTADTGDRLLDSNVVRGAVGGNGVDDYRYSGSLVFDSTDGPLTVTLELNQH